MDNQDISKGFKQFADMLNDPDGVEKLKALISAFQGGQARQGDSEPQSERGAEAGTPPPDPASDSFQRMRQIVENLNPADDPRAKLLTALKPFLNQRRQGTLDQYVKYLGLARLMSMMNNPEGGGK